MSEGANDQILHELDALSHTMYPSHSKRRTTSLALPRSTTGDGNAGGGMDDIQRAAVARPPSRRMSMSPFRSRPTKLDKIKDDDDDDEQYGGRVGVATPLKSQSFGAARTTPSVAGERKGLWGWRPMRSLSRIGMQRVGCLFSVEVVAVVGLPLSMNGLRLMVAARKEESREGAVQTVPSRVQQGAADFEETLFVRCNLYCNGGGSKPLRFEPRPFLVTAVAVDAPEIDFGRSVVDLSLLVKESAEKARQGERVVRQWDMAFPLAGKAKGAELLVKLAFQIMDGGGVELYGQQQGGKNASTSSSSSLFARKQSKTSFSIASPKQVTRSETSPLPATTPPDLQGIDDFKLDAPGEAETIKQEKQNEPDPEDSEFFPEFDVVDKGVEEEQEQEGNKDEPIMAKEEAAVKAKEQEEKAREEEVVKEVVHDSAHARRRNELEAITNQIKALESMMLRDEEDDSYPSDAPAKPAEPPQVVAGIGMEADEDEVTRQFLQLLEQGDADTMTASKPRAVSSLKSGASKPGSTSSVDDAECYVSDLGKGLGPVVQTRDGGYLAAMNPFDVPVVRKELPKLAMHLSKPLILRDHNKLPAGGSGGVEVFQRLCAGGLDTLLAKLGSRFAMDDVVGKTAEQIALEGMASAIVTARGSNKDLVVAGYGAAESISLLRTMAAATSHGRRDRVATGIWNAHDAPVSVDEVLAVSLQRIEAMAVDALKVQADMADDKAPFEVPPAASENPWAGHVLDAAAPLEEWATACAGAGAVTMVVAVQLRDPLRRYEAVGAPSIVVIQAAGAAGDGEPKFKVASMHLGGLRLKSADRRCVWDGKKQRLTAMHWLVAYGLGKVDGGRKSRAVAAVAAKAGSEVLWSMSSRIMADMWLKSIRNPDVKLR